MLSNDDWLELSELHSLLKPLKEASILVQHSGEDVTTGSLFRALQATDWLLAKLESKKKELLHLPHNHFKACINLGWKKLDKYYQLNDLTAAYRAAIALHPHYKMQWFEEHWSGEHPAWIKEAKMAIRELFSDYKRRHGDEAIAVEAPLPQGMELTEFERFNMLKGNTFIHDDLERYLAEERAPPTTNPLVWWHQNESRYPILRHMAFDLLATPASSSADERQFSMAGHVLDEEYWHTLDDLAEAHQCLKSAYGEGIVE